MKTINGPLSGKRGLIIGIANANSIAYGCAEACRAQGAELAATYLNEKAHPHVAPLTAQLDVPETLLMPFDIEAPGDLKRVVDQLASEWGQVDFVVHAMASATKAMTKSRLVDVTAEDFSYAMRVTCHSFLEVAAAVEPLMKASGGSLVTMTYLGAQRVMGNYHFMAPMKAALESCVRYMADELAAQNIRVHGVSPGAIATRAASGIQAFDALLDVTERRAPLRRLTTPRDVGELTAFLVGPGAEMMTGGIHFVDGGYHVMG